MLVRITDKTLDRIDDEPEYNGKLSKGLAKSFRDLMQVIRDADHENDLRAFKSRRFEKLKGDRKHEYSMRLNDQFRLIFRIEKAGEHNQLVITGIEDYH